MYRYNNTTISIETKVKSISLLMLFLDLIAFNKLLNLKNRRIEKMTIK